MQAFMMLIPTVGGSLVGSLIGSVKSKSKQMKALQAGMRIEMRHRIREIYTSIYGEDGDGKCSIEDKENVQEIYEVYTELGGNGTTKKLYESIMNAGVKE